MVPDWVKELKTHLNKYGALDKFRRSLIDGRAYGIHDITHVHVYFAIGGCFSWDQSLRIFGVPTKSWDEISQVWYQQTRDSGYGQIDMSRAELADLLKDTPTKRLLSYVRSELAP